MRPDQHLQANQIGAQSARRAVIGRWRIELLPRSPYDAAYTPDMAIIGFAFESQVGVHAFGSDRRTGFRAKPNGLAYVPAGCDVYSQSEHGGEYLKIAFRPEEGDLPACGRRFSNVIDRTTIGAAQRLRSILLSPDLVDSLRYEGLVSSLDDCVVRILRGGDAEPRSGAWMTPRRLRHVDELIEAGLDKKLTVQELAAALGLSAGFFSRAFKAAVGKAPHDYIIDRRISRARALMRAGALGLDMVALSSGFTSHAHMTATFRSRLGVTPSQLRDIFA
ncbi:helix-turn-helix transcriptional regulator [Bosea sp. LjRoot90]|uniref:AraC family transcriptional regulator n=1 Tax=Bosea sp. LjRoot90 TaxID=3342342 RepID=UPI003ECD2BB3